MSRLHFENFRINASQGNNLSVKLLPMICKGVGSLDSLNIKGQFSTWNYKEPGRYVKNCYFKDIFLPGKTGGGPGLIYLAGADAKHPVKDVTFENVARFGEPTFADLLDIIIGPYTKKISFKLKKISSTDTRKLMPVYPLIKRLLN